MSRKTLLIIFTYKYPFEPPTEQFLDDEIRFLNRKDVDILLVPNAREKEKAMYPFAKEESNVRICELKRERVQKEMIFGSVKILKKLSQVVGDMQTLSHNVEPRFRKSINKLTFEQYVQGGALYQELIHQMPKEYLRGREQIILYSYWLNSMIIAEALYKEYLEKATSAKIFAYSRAHGDGDLYVEGMRSYRPGIKLINKDINAVFPISENGRATLNHQGIVHAETYRLGVKKRSDFLREASGIPLIVSCSVINDNKRVEKIVEILSQLHMNVRWIHFGGGANEQKVKNLCNQILPHNIQWKINGWTDHEQILEFYEKEKPDLFINVSKVEGIPVSIMEAMSLSIPCVATNVGASSEIIINNKNGFLLKPDFDVHKASLEIMDFLSKNADEKNSMRQAAFEMFMKEYNSDTNYSAFSNRILSNEETSC